MFKITWQELKDRKWSLLAFCVGSLLMLWLYVATFESSQNSTKQLQELVKTYPKGLLDALGLSDLNISSIERYLNAKHFSLIWPLLAIILALSRAGNQFAGEIQTGTMGLLLSQPISRLRIFWAKYCTGLVTILVFCAVSLFAVIPVAAAYGFDSHPRILFDAFILTSLFMLTVYSLGLAVSVWVSDKSKVYGLTSAFMIAQYMCYILALVSDTFASLKHYSLFYYFNTQEVLATGHIAVRSWLVFGVSIIAASLLAAWHFNRRDISV